MLSVCADRAWFTPLGAAYQPRPYDDFPGDGQGAYQVNGMARMRPGALTAELPASRGRNPSVVCRDRARANRNPHELRP